VLYSHGAILTAGADLSSEMLRNGLAGCEAVFLLIRSVIGNCIECCSGCYAQELTTHFAASTRISRQGRARSALGGAIAISVMI
jgi:hypothetical protein